MSLLSFSSLLNAVVAGLLVFLSLVREKKSAHITFGLFCFSIFLYSALHFAWLIAPNEASGLFFGRNLMFGAIFIPVLFLHFSGVITGKAQSLKSWLILGYGLAGAFTLANFGPHLVSGVTPKLGLRFYPIAGPLIHAQFGMFCFYVALAFWVLISSLNHSSGIQHERIRYLLAGAGLGFSGGSTYYLLYYGVPLQAWRNFLVFSGLAIMAYALLRIRLEEMGMAMRKVLIHVFFVWLFVIPMALLVAWAKSISLAVSVVVAMGVLLPWIINSFNRKLAKLVDALPPFRQRLARFQGVGEKIEKIASAATVEDWAWKVIGVIQSVFPVKGASLLLRDDKENQFLIRAGFGLNVADMGLLSLPADSPVVRRLENSGEMVFAELAGESFPAPEAADAQGDLAFLHASVCLPIFHEGRLAAIVNVDQKHDGEMFHDLDLAHLDKLVHAAEHVLDVMMSGMSRAQRSAEWAHDLIRPFGAKGSFRLLSEMLEGHFGAVTPEAKTALSLITGDAEFVAGHLGKILNPSGLDTYDIQPASLAPAYRRIQAKYAPLAMQQGIQWTVQVLPEDMRVICDRPVIEHRVIANLVDNAFRHTPRGGTVELGYRVEGNTFTGFVRDTGLGIRPEDLERVFNPGVQLADGAPGQFGLGLSIVRQVMKAHQGRAWAESEYGNGSSFVIELPISKTSDRVKM